MAEERDYKYKVELNDSVMVLKRIYSDAGRQNQEVMVNDTKGVWKPNLGMRKKDFKFTRTSAAMYGEFIANLLQEKIGFPSCKVEMVKRNLVLPRSASGKTVEVPGCISYMDLKEGETLVQTINVLAWYKREHPNEYVEIMNPLGEHFEGDHEISIYNEKNNNNIELVIPAMETYVKERCNATPEQIQQLRQDIINMVVFDCKFGNTDRNDENYGISISQDGFRLYPTFDNEYILGFPEYVEDIEKFSGARLQEHIDKDLTSRMGITSQVSKIGYQSMLTYLFTTFPEETKKAYENVMKITEADLVEIMDDCEDLDEVHKDYALRIFRSRNRGFKYVKEEYIDEQGNFIPQVLPGNKPMELVKRRGSSKSPVSKTNDSVEQQTVPTKKDHEIQTRETR